MDKELRLIAASSSSSQCGKLAEWLAVPMFCLSLFFLAILAGLTVVWVDMAAPAHLPVEADLASGVEGEAIPDAFLGLRKSAVWAGYVLFTMLVSIWPLFLLEPMYCRWYGRRNGAVSNAAWSTDLWAVICPPLRLAKPIAEKSGKIWLPKFGWHAPGKPLAKVLEKVFSKPMLIIAMLILPILLIEFGFSQQVRTMPWLKLALSVSTGLIWCAFAIEFIIMVNATDKKFAYIKKNWIDLAIILLPLVSFLRSLRIVRAANIAKFAKVQQLSKMSRIYRMRGLVAKSIRALMVLEVLHRVFKVSPEKRIKKLILQLEEKEEEANEIRSRIQLLQSQIAEQEKRDLPQQDVAEDQSETFGNWQLRASSLRPMGMFKPATYCQEVEVR